MLVAVLERYPEVGERIAANLGARALRVKCKTFPDGELYVRVPEDVKGEEVLVVSTTFPNQSDSIIELLLLADALRRTGASELIGAIPYLAYARQDKVFLQGEPVSAEVVLDILLERFSKLIVVDYHSPGLLAKREGRAFNVLISDILVRASLKYLSDPIVIAPDKGALERAKFAAERLGLQFDYMIKERDRVTGEIRHYPKELDVGGRDVVLIDDIISTGGTIADAAKILLGQGARKVVVAASHGLMLGEALNRIKGAGAHKVILANTLAAKVGDPLVEYVDISERLSSEIANIVGGRR